MKLNDWYKLIKKNGFVPILVSRVKFIRKRQKNKAGKKKYEYAWGETLPKYSQKTGPYITIDISEKENKTHKDMVQTIFHEALHKVFFIITAWLGLRYTAYSEERFVEEMEDNLLINWHLLKAKKKK